LAGRQIDDFMYETLGKIAKPFPWGMKPSNSQALVVGAKEFLCEPKKKSSAAKADLQGKHMRHD
jgi:hypothetical protein